MNNIYCLLLSKSETFIELVGRAVGPVAQVRLVVVGGVDEVLTRLDREPAALVLVHQAEDEGTAEAARLVRALESGGRGAPVVVLSDRHRPEEALTLLRLGAADYLSRPLDLNRLAYLVDTLTLRARYADPRAEAGPEVGPRLVCEAGDAEPFFYIDAAAMGRMMEQVRRVAPQPTTVLLGGETGTGKTRLARLIHDLSCRRDQPFLVVNCGALSATLIESEMFGHVRGAFTGADRDRVGKFAEAGGGTLLLDEVDSLPLALQAKLLRVVEERIFEAVGSNRAQPMTARLIAACNRPLDQEVAAGRFRADLYYRLNVVSFDLPPLRARPGIVPHLARSFAADYAGRAGRLAPRIAEAALRALEAHAWPGNIRELRNALERAVALSDDTIEPADLPDALRAAAPAHVPAAPTPAAPAVPRASGSLSQFKELAELARIRDALNRHGNNRLRAAAELGISRMTLYKKLHKYGLMTV